MHVTRAVLPHLRARRSGLLVTISSISGLVASAGGSIYSATKFAVEGWAEGLAQEVAPLGIRSLVVEPGLMRTDFLSDRSMRQGGLDVPDYADAVAQFRTFIASANHQQPGDPAQLAARIVALAATPSPAPRVRGRRARVGLREGRPPPLGDRLVARVTRLWCARRADRRVRGLPREPAA
jgi:NAD(P)-dependent dehydrogenase (short-subunit alcohol dehydrogenase family)